MIATTSRSWQLTAPILYTEFAAGLQDKSITLKMPVTAAIPLKSFPFIRLATALTAGIIVEWYFKIPLEVILVLATCTLIVLPAYFILPLSKRFVLAPLQGTIILLLFVCFGMIITWQQNIHNNTKWYGNIYTSTETLLLTIQEPLVEKPKSYKALAEVSAVYKNNKLIASSGNVLLYFKKDSLIPNLKYGTQIIFNKSLQEIQNSGNPAAMNYNRYCLFQNITNQAFLSTGDYKILSSTNVNFFQNILFNIRDWALLTLKQNIHSPKELGIAEALLIGYRNDLDKELVEAYSNTGVVHIIAISGLHIGVIYSALLMFFSLFKSSKAKKWIEPVCILLIIWMFTLIAGAAPSVLRASVMFTCILFGKFLNRNSNIYNTLAASAFILLVINPFYLWDVGFQLSYAAVFSIVIFFKSINNLLYFRNRLMRWIWGLAAVSLSAQIFALPLVIYHFHQLPVLFLFSNLLVVPLSGIVLFGELILFAFSWWKQAALIIGWVTETCIKWMNDFIQHINNLSFSVWDGLHITIIQLALLFVCIAFFSLWIFSKNTKNFIVALCFLTAFFSLQDIYVLHHKQQSKLIVYNIPKQSAVDIISGGNCSLAGDSLVLKDPLIRNFNVKPSRVKYSCYHSNDVVLPDVKNHILKINNSLILFLNNTHFKVPAKEKIKLKALILSAGIKKSPAELKDFFECDFIVADSSIPQWKTAKWKKECEQLHLRFYSVAQDGAFILNL